MARRVARILPLHYLTVFVHIVFVTPGVWRQDSFVQNLLAHLFFCHNLFPGFHGAINGSNWSVGVELQFYLLVCFLAPMLKKARPLVIGLGGTLLAVTWRYFSFIYLKGKSFTTGVVVDSQVFFLTTQLPGLLDSFSLGVCLAKFLFRKDAPALRALTYAAVWIGACVFSYSLLWQYFAVKLYWHDVLMVTFWRSGLALSCTSVLLLATTATASKRAQLALSWLKYLGDISYGIYLWHLPVLVSLKEANWESNGNALCLVICLTLVCASASWHFVEQPLSKIVYALCLPKKKNSLFPVNALFDSASQRPPVT
jgi:peptidoglycan/LPS O-acetylase OafA/YrhL